MQDETQGLHLAKVVHKHHRYPEYELAFPEVAIKQSSFKKLKVGDVVLLGFSYLDMRLLSNGLTKAKVVVELGAPYHRVRIVSLEEGSKRTLESSSKYTLVRCSFGLVQSRVLQEEHKIDISSLDMKHVTLWKDETQKAKGVLCCVEDEIAIEIIKVYE